QEGAHGGVISFLFIEGDAFFEIGVGEFPIPANARVELVDGFFVLCGIGIIDAFDKKRVDHFAGGVSAKDIVADGKRDGVAAFGIEVGQLEAVGIYGLQ